MLSHVISQVTANRHFVYDLLKKTPPEDFDVKTGGAGGGEGLDYGDWVDDDDDDDGSDVEGENGAPGDEVSSTADSSVNDSKNGGFSFRGLDLDAPEPQGGVGRGSLKFHAPSNLK